MKLYKETEPILEHNGKTYEYQNDFRAFLKVNAIIKDEEILTEDKLDFINEYLFFGKTGPETLEVLKKYMERYGGNSGGRKVFDIEQDAGYIYASFWQCYQIDLYRAELTTERFLALLRGLPKNCRLSEIIELRSMDIPAPNKYNTKYRQSLISAQKAVALITENDNPFGEFGKTIAELATIGKENGG